MSRAKGKNKEENRSNSSECVTGQQLLCRFTTGMTLLQRHMQLNALHCQLWWPSWCSTAENVAPVSPTRANPLLTTSSCCRGPGILTHTQLWRVMTAKREGVLSLHSLHVRCTHRGATPPPHHCSPGLSSFFAAPPSQTTALLALLVEKGCNQAAPPAESSTPVHTDDELPLTYSAGWRKRSKVYLIDPSLHTNS